MTAGPALGDPRLDALGDGSAPVERRRVAARTRLRDALGGRVPLLRLLLLAALLGAWEWAGRASPDFTFAPPSSVVGAAGDMIASGTLGGALTDSLLGLAIGVGLAVLIGNAVGLTMGWAPALGATLNPFVAAAYVVPIAALVPVFVVWTGVGTVSRVLVVFLFAVFDVTLTAQSGARGVDPALVDVARTFGAGRRQTLLRVLLPASLPFVLLGLRLAVIRGIKGMVVAEILFAQTGLGGLIVKYVGLFRMDEVLVVVATLALLGALLYGAVLLVERYALRWRP